MKNILFVIFALSLVLLAQGVPTRLTYQLNQEVVFNVNGYLDSKGALVNSNQRTSGSFSTMNGTLAIQCNLITQIIKKIISNFFYFLT